MDQFLLLILYDSFYRFIIQLYNTLKSSSPIEHDLVEVIKEENDIVYEQEQLNVDDDHLDPEKTTIQSRIVQWISIPLLKRLLLYVTVRLSLLVLSVIFWQSFNIAWIIALPPITYYLCNISWITTQADLLHQLTVQQFLRTLASQFNRMNRDLLQLNSRIQDSELSNWFFSISLMDKLTWINAVISFLMRDYMHYLNPPNDALTKSMKINAGLGARANVSKSLEEHDLHKLFAPDLLSVLLTLYEHSNHNHLYDKCHQQIREFCYSFIQYWFLGILLMDYMPVIIAIPVLYTVVQVKILYKVTAEYLLQRWIMEGLLSGWLIYVDAIPLWSLVLLWILVPMHCYARLFLIAINATRTGLLYVEYQIVKANPVMIGNIVLVALFCNGRVVHMFSVFLLELLIIFNYGYAKLNVDIVSSSVLSSMAKRLDASAILKLKH